MKTINAVANALYRCCNLELRECDGCPYRGFGDICATELAGDAEHYLRLLQSEAARWEERETNDGHPDGP